MDRAFRITETVDGATYTGAWRISPGWRIVDLLLETFAAWTAATATLDVGDSDAADSLAAAVDLTSVSFDPAGTANGTAWGNAGGDGDAYSAPGTGKLYPAGDTITLAVTAGTPGGPTGLSLVTFLLEPPPLTRSLVAAV